MSDAPYRGAIAQSVRSTGHAWPRLASNSDGLNPRFWRLNPEQARGITSDPTVQGALPLPRSAGILTCRWTSGIVCPVVSYQRQLSPSVATPSPTMRFPERSFGSASPHTPNGATLRA